MGQFRNRAYRRQFHLFIDSRCANIQRATEDKREAKDVVDLVWIVRTTGANDGIRTHFFRQRRQNFRFRVRQRQDHWRTSHFLHHFLGQHFRAGTSKENIRAFNHIIEGTFAVIHHRICGFGFRHVWLTALIDNAF